MHIIIIMNEFEINNSHSVWKRKHTI